MFKIPPSPQLNSKSSTDDSLISNISEIDNCFMNVIFRFHHIHSNLATIPSSRFLFLKRVCTGWERHVFPMQGPLNRTELCAEGRFTVEVTSIDFVQHLRVPVQRNACGLFYYDQKSQIIYRYEPHSVS